jgi:hypothetical protein
VVVALKTEASKIGATETVTDYRYYAKTLLSYFYLPLDSVTDTVTDSVTNSGTDTVTDLIYYSYFISHDHLALTQFSSPIY